jgi:hypothetical protein
MTESELNYKTDDEETEFRFNKLDQNILEYVNLETNTIIEIKAHQLMELLLKTDFLERRGYRPLQIETDIKYGTIFDEVIDER